MKLCRFEKGASGARVGLCVEQDQILDVTDADLPTLAHALNTDRLAERLAELSARSLPHWPVADVKLLAPVDQQEIWAAGVTYLRSRTARMEESNFSASAYDRVYEAPRPELFFKCLPGKVVGPNEPVGIRHDARWSVPEPELVLVVGATGALVGYTIGNDMTARDIEGENTLYLPQAKVYSRSCAIGPYIVVGASEDEARSWSIFLEIIRNGSTAFQGETKVSQIKRPFAELSDFLTRSQEFPQGAMLLTGTGIVPPDDFALETGDRIRIRISGIGELQNHVVRV